MPLSLSTVFLSVSIAALPAAPAAAQDAAPRDEACPAARVGLSELGYASYREGDAYRGTSVDVITELHRRMGCSFTFEWFPHNRLYLQFSTGKLELAVASVRTPERDRYGTWIPYTTTEFFLLLTNGSAGKFSSLADFVEHSTARLNVTRGVTYPAAALVQMARLQQQGRLEYVSDYSVVFKKIVAGRAEGTLAPPVVHVRYTRQFKLEDKLVVTPVAEMRRSLLGLYVSKRLVTPQTTQRYADTLRAMVEDGTVQKIYSRYLGEAIAQQTFSGGAHEITDAIPR